MSYAYGYTNNDQQVKGLCQLSSESTDDFFLQEQYQPFSALLPSLTARCLKNKAVGRVDYIAKVRLAYFFSTPFACSSLRFSSHYLDDRDARIRPHLTHTHMLRTYAVKIPTSRLNLNKNFKLLLLRMSASNFSYKSLVAWSRTQLNALLEMVSVL